MSGLEPRSAGRDDRRAAQRSRRSSPLDDDRLCIPMLLIPVVLMVSGVANAGFIVIALACTAMMALMMTGMGHGDGNK